MFTIKTIMAGIIVTVLVGMGVLAWQYRTELQISAGLRKDKQQLIEANEQNQQAINELQIEKQRLERALDARAKEQARIEQQSRQETARLRNQLEQLKVEYEDIEEFMRITAPNRFVDEWMRERSRNNNKDGDSAD